MELPVSFPAVTHQNVPLAKRYSPEQLKAKIDRFDSKRYRVFSEEADTLTEDTAREMLFEQYKMYQRTSEELVTRRQKTNEFYLSINTFLLTFFGVIIGWAEMPVKSKLIILSVTALAGVMFNQSWCSTIDQLKIINTAKLRLINTIERQLPLRLYDEEYAIMNDELNPWKYKNAFRDEKRSPYIFNGLYAVLIALFALYALIESL